MPYNTQKFFNEFRQMVDLFWWSFIKAPAAFIAAWAFFSMMSNPANVASQSMEIARNGGGLPPELMTGVVTVWFLSGCTMLGVALFVRIVFKVRLFQSREEADRSNSSFVFHP